MQWQSSLAWPTKSFEAKIGDVLKLTGADHSEGTTAPLRNAPPHASANSLRQELLEAFQFIVLPWCKAELALEAAQLVQFFGVLG
mmetsp:Transcript_101725/g.286840  ORF Transcript_101725/g.286840 Transcript_101725/m.286840 type:complete len:85 (-) Transcript_101725:645-899(-)